MEQKTIRINKYLSELGYCSRREADRLIDQKRITINGEIAQKGSQISENDRILIDNKILEVKKTSNIYLAFNKPTGIVCTSDKKREKNNIIDYINYPERIYPVGRLDKDSQGLILLTNDGEIVNKILKARNFHEKEYIVEVDRPLSADFLRHMREGVPILDTITRPCTVKKRTSHSFQIILTQGLNRQIRRMCQQLDYQVRSLKRIRIMNIHLDLELGQYRHLSAGELSELNKLVDEKK